MKKGILIAIALLIGCDITLIFAANGPGAATQSNQDLEQLQLLAQAPSAQQVQLDLQRIQQQQAQQQAQVNQQQNGPASIVEPSTSARSEVQSPAATSPDVNPQIPLRQTNQAPASANNQPMITPQQAVDAAAFNQVQRNLFPMTPGQIMNLRQSYDSTQLAATATPEGPPKPTATSMFVSLAPGATPPVIRLAQGFVSSLVFLDSTGAPWPILAWDLGNPEAFNIVWDKTSNTMMVQATKQYTYGNLAVRLQNLSTPVMLTLIPGQRAVDYRVDLRIQGFGPNPNAMPTSEGLPGTENTLLLSILDGVAPPGGTELTISGGDAQAWASDDKLFVRTRLTILSPAWLSTLSSADGMHVYELQKTPLLLVSADGKIMQLKIQGL